MALLDPGPPPEIVARSHRDYLAWIEHWCWDRACAYCLEHARVLELDHVEPESLKPERAKDPTNLLPACATCNGPTGKWDYHPERQPRRKCPDETHGFLALDPRVDDLATLYEVKDDGALDVQPGATYDRAKWNRDVLFRLDRRRLKEWRRQTMDLRQVAEELVAEIAEAGADASGNARRRRDTIVREIAGRWLFFELFEIALSDELTRQLQAMRDELRRE